MNEKDLAGGFQKISEIFCLFRSLRSGRDGPLRCLSPLFMSPGSSGPIAFPGHAGTFVVHPRMSQGILESQNVRAGECLSQRGVSIERREAVRLHSGEVCHSAGPRCGHGVPQTNN